MSEVTQYCDQLEGLCPDGPQPAKHFVPEFPSTEIATIVRLAREGKYTDFEFIQSVLQAIGNLHALVRGPQPIGNAAGLDPGTILSVLVALKGLAEALGWKLPFMDVE